MPPTGFAHIARVVKPHGLNGEVAVVARDDLDLATFIGVDCWFVPPPSGVRTARLESVRPGPKGPLLSFADVDSIDHAARLRGTEVLVREDLVPEPDDAENFDAVGLRLHDERRGDLGGVVDVIVTGANDVWVVEGPFGQVLVPVIDDVVLSIDNEARTASVRLLPGLLASDDE